MRYQALACDYDGTVADHGVVDEETLAGLRRLTDSGRKLLLVTGRELEDLRRVFANLQLFERVVAENGALLFRPAADPGDEAVVALAERPPDAFATALRERGVDPLSVGHVIVATWHPNETTVLEVIRDLGVELEIIFNKGAVMVLPPGVNKASGLAAALTELGLSPHNTVGVGDAENDHAFLSLCECSVAVDNALPALKERCDEVTASSRGAGVVQLIDQMLADDLAGLQNRLTRHDVLLGRRDNGEDVRLAPQGPNVLVAGPSSSGKSDLISGLLERLVTQKYQVLVVDPEGDYEILPDVVHLGTHDRPPTVFETMDALGNPSRSVVVNLLGIKLEDRPLFLEDLLAHLHQLRARTGRPHRIIIDEAHHLLPPTWQPGSARVTQELDGLVLVAPHAGSIAIPMLESVDLVVAVGDDKAATIQAVANAVGLPAPQLDRLRPQDNQALAWWRRDGAQPFLFRYAPSTFEHRRHIRKYAAGNLGEDKSFYLRGPDSALHLRAQNLQLFLQLADGVDDATWLHHLREGDYARWFRDAIKNEPLAAEVEQIQHQFGDDPVESRARLRQAVQRRYTTPA